VRDWYKMALPISGAPEPTEGPWTELLDAIRTLQIRQLMGEDQAVHNQIAQLEQQLSGLPEPPHAARP
jgi:hypothetical protein